MQMTSTYGLMICYLHSEQNQQRTLYCLYNEKKKKDLALYFTFNIPRIECETVLY